MKKLSKAIAEIQNTIEDLNERLSPEGKLPPKDFECFKQIIEEIGWPKISLVGEKTAAEAWVIAIESITPNSEFHKKCLELMKNCEESSHHESYIQEFEMRLKNG